MFHNSAGNQCFLSFFFAFINVGSPPLLECIAELHSQQGTGRITGNALVELCCILHLFHVFVEQVRRDIEVVVVDDGGVYLSAEMLKYRPHYIFHLLNCFIGLYVIIFEVDVNGDTSF